MLSGVTSSLPRLSPSRLVETVRSIDLPSPKSALDDLKEKVQQGRDAIRSFAGGDLIREGRDFVGGVKEKVEDLRENGLSLRDRVLIDGAKRTSRGVAHTHTAVNDLTSEKNRVFHPDTPVSRRQVRPDGEVRVSSWNLHHGTSPDSQGASNTLAQQITELKRAQSDVIVLQEVLPWQVEEIVNKTGMVGYYSQTTARQGNMILLDPALKVEGNHRQTLNYDLQKGDTWDALKASWETKGDEPRAAQALTIRRPDGKGNFTVFNTHLSSGSASPQDRAAESQKFQQFVARTSREGAAVGGGDFNMGRNNSMLEGFRQSGFLIEGDRIDHLLNRGVDGTVVSVSDPHRGELRLSDHPMVTGTYQFG